MLQQTAKNGWALSNPEKYSLEHYIITDCGNLEIKYNDTTISIPYSKQIKRYRNSLSIYHLYGFLFVFILPTQDTSFQTRQYQIPDIFHQSELLETLVL